MARAGRPDDLNDGCTALWYVAPARVDLRAGHLPALDAGTARVRTLYSLVSRGTERLVFHGLIPPSEWDRMRCPCQEGAFPHPVKYGYCAVGVVDEGPTALLGRAVFALHPHQDRFVCDTSWLTPVPQPVPARRAVLAANMETALNALWDGGAGPGDRIVVVGGGIVGLLVARLAARIPGAEVTVVDPLLARRSLVEAFGARYAAPGNAPEGADLVVHSSASSAGLATALSCAGDEGTVIELSWYGDKRVEAPLGGLFHSGRLKLVSSQVGRVSESRRPRWTHARRVAKALDLLDDPVLDRLLTTEVAFADLPAALPKTFAPEAEELTLLVRYGG